METALVLVVVLGAAAYLGRRAWRAVRGPEPEDACGGCASSCASADAIVEAARAAGDRPEA